MMWYDIWYFPWLLRWYDIFDIFDNAHRKEYFLLIFLQLAADFIQWLSYMYVVVLAYSDHGIVMISCSAGVCCVAHGRADANMFSINLGKARRR